MKMYTQRAIVNVVEEEKRAEYVGQGFNGWRILAAIGLSAAILYGATRAACAPREDNPAKSQDTVRTAYQR